MPAPRLLPSVEEVVVGYLAASPLVAALADDRIGTVLAAEGGPAVQVTLVGGEERLARHLDAARIQVDTWGGTKDQADVLARTVRAVLLEMPYAGVDGAVVTDVRTLLAPRWLSDGAVEPPRPRYSADYEVVLHP